MFVTTIGTGVRALAEDWKNKGDYLRSHILQVLALEGAEAFAELLHVKIRQMWGIGDPPGLSLKDLVQAHYHGKRFSFGYPACPRLEDQEQLFRLLEVDKNAIGVQLTDGFMMDPESAVSAVVFHHPEAKYFSLSPADIERLEREFEAARRQARRQLELCYCALLRSSRSASSRSASIINSASCSNFTLGVQPSWRFAFEASPISRSTSAGRKKR